MRLRLKAIGTGVEGDPFRVNLPTYTHVDGDPEEDGYMVVEVPDEVHGLTAEHLSHETQVEHESGNHYAELCKDCVSAVHDHFDERYREHKGKFRLEFA